MTDVDTTVAETIIEQMGGVRTFRLMLGPNAPPRIHDDGQGITFRWPSRQPSRGNTLEIRFDRGRDEYFMTFRNVRGGNDKTVRTVDGVYVEQLVSIFEEQTGWALRVPQIRRV